MKTLFILFALASVGIATLFAQAGNASASKESLGDVYTLNVTDKIGVRIFQEEELTTVAGIDAQGNINLNLVGDVKVAGLTVRQAASAIEAAYREAKFLKSPRVTVTIEQYSPREVAITGQVRAPGRYTLPNEGTWSVIDLVFKAGGLTDVAKGTAVVITRISLDGTKTSYTVDVESIIKGKGKGKATDPALILKPNDFVFVPESII